MAGSRWWARWRRESTRPEKPSEATRSRGAQDRLDAASQAQRSSTYTEALLNSDVAATASDPVATTPGPPLDRRAPFLIGLLAALGLCAGFGIVLIVVHLSEIITWVVVALFIALGLDPIVSRLVRFGFSRGWAVLVSVLGVLAVLGLASLLIVPPIVDQVDLLVKDAPGYVDKLENSAWLQQIDQRWHIGDQLLNHLKGSVRERALIALFGGILGVGAAFAHWATAVFTVVVLTVYFVAAMPTVKAAAYKIVPRSRRPRVMYLSEEITRRVGGYILGQLCVAAINAFFAYLILVVLDLPFPAVLATVVGLLALIPIVGTVVGGVIMILVALTTGWVQAAIMVGYYVAYHVFETYVLSPRIMHRVVNVPSVVTIVAVLAGGTLLGVVGALIAIPVAAGLLLLYDEVLVPRQEQN